MRPEDWKPFGGGAAETSLHPAVIAALVVGALLIWILPRQYLLKLFLPLSILIPQVQQLVFLGVHFPVLRILVLCVWIRISPELWGKRRFLAGGFASADVVLTAWLGWTAVAYGVAWGTIGAVVPKLGVFCGSVGTYFLFRHLVRDKATVEQTIRVFSIICVVLAVFMVVEQVTGRNLLDVFGAAPFSEVRDGRIRSQGSFAHSINAGAFGAFLLPAFLSLWWSRRSRRYGVIGTCAAAVIAATSSSSTPISAAAVGAAAVFMWPLRPHMRKIRWGALITLFSLHMVMKAPVWALLNRVRVFGKSSGWHRFLLVDQCINRFGEWWLIGTRNNDSWGFSMWDMQNWYVGCAVTSGMIGLGLFVSLISLSFRHVGIAWRSLFCHYEAQRLVWGLGAGMFASAVAFLGCELYDQAVVGWYALPALILAVASGVRSDSRGAATSAGGEATIELMTPQEEDTPSCSLPTA